MSTKKAKITYQIETGCVEEGYPSIEALKKDHDWIEFGEPYVVYEVRPVGTLIRKADNVYTPNKKS